MEYKEIKQRVLEDVDLSTKRKKKRLRRRVVLRTILEFLIIIIVISGLFNLVIGMSRVEGDSMYPSLHNRELVFYNRLMKTYGKGDIIAIQMPNDEMYVKRVVAIAGDTVNIEGGKLYVNGKAQTGKGTYGETKPMKKGVVFPVTVGEGEVFVLGDNREISDDSRMFGSVKIENTEGKLVYYIGQL